VLWAWLWELYILRGRSIKHTSVTNLCDSLATYIHTFSYIFSWKFDLVYVYVFESGFKKMISLLVSESWYFVFIVCMCLFIVQQNLCSRSIVAVRVHIYVYLYIYSILYVCTVYMTVSTISASTQHQSVLKNTLHSKWRVLDFCWYPKKSISFRNFFLFFLFRFKEFTFSIKNHYIESIKIVFSLSFIYFFKF